MESRHRLLLSVSHDIKSPLTSILGYSDRKNQDSETSTAVGNSARYILSLLENLLEFSSLEQGALTTTFSDFHLKTMCDEIVQMFKPLADAKHLEFDYESVDTHVHSDQIKVKQIIINLISNAIKYTSKGNVSLTIGYTDEKILIRVKDSGAGMPASKIPELYKPFTRLESNSTLAHGSGLGMYVVKGLIDLLGGTISIDSIVGKGTEIEVVIPAIEASTPLPVGSKKIQVYDDDPVVLRLAKDILRELGHQTVENNGDIILTDMEMGAVSGLDILKNAGATPVVLMTGKSDFTLEQALQLGFSGYLPKPFTRDQLKNIFGEGEKQLIDDLLGDDREEIIEIFKIATAENFTLLGNTLESSDFDKAQSICHKMLPMFAQLGFPADELQRMDMHKGNRYTGWEDDVIKILNIKI
jgi:CheY-like chemotaxis protein/two-component sensor histidine kinase